MGVFRSGVKSIHGGPAVSVVSEYAKFSNEVFVKK
jgi:hypothetical protein